MEPGGAPYQRPGCSCIRGPQGKGVCAQLRKELSAGTGLVGATPGRPTLSSSPLRGVCPGKVPGSCEVSATGLCAWGAVLLWVWAPCPGAGAALAEPRWPPSTRRLDPGPLGAGRSFLAC